ncbi:MAG: hypothetical protein EHM87_24375, partial [Burkholderiales bacterium]
MPDNLLAGFTKAASGGSEALLENILFEIEQAEKAKAERRQNVFDVANLNDLRAQTQGRQVQTNLLQNPVQEEKPGKWKLNADLGVVYNELTGDIKTAKDEQGNILKTADKPVKTETSQEERQTDRLMDLYGQREAAPGYGGMLPGPPDPSLIVPFEREIPMLESVLGIGNKPPKEVEPGKLEERAKAGIGLAKEFISAGFAVPEAIA